MAEEKRGELQKIIDKFNSVYLIEDKNIVKMLISVVASQSIPGDPVWIMILAPSAGCKSEFINSISGVPGVVPLSTLTANTFISGQKGQQESSLLLNMQNGIITFKDFTSLLSEHPDARGVIMAQLREIYDGRYTKAFGSTGGKPKVWEGKITIIAGSTYAIHSKKAQYVSMGERFLFYNLEQPSRIEASEKAMDNQASGKMKEMRDECQNLITVYFKEHFELPPEIPNITKEQRKDLILLAELTTRARSDVERNWRSPQQEIIAVYPPEMPTRVATQLQQFSRSIAVVNWNETGKAEVLPSDMKIFSKFTLDSITSYRRTAMQELARYEMITTSGLAVKIGFPTNSVRVWLQDLVALEIAERYKRTGNKGDEWRIKDNYRDIISKFENIKVEGGALEDKNIQTPEEEPNTIPPEYIEEANRIAQKEVRPQLI